MQITDIRIRRIHSEGKLKAYATITFENCFVVHNVKIIEGKSGLFIAMPSRRTKAGEYKDVAHPISSEFRNELQDKILEAYYAQEEELHSDAEQGTSAKAEAHSNAEQGASPEEEAHSNAEQDSEPDDSEVE